MTLTSMATTQAAKTTAPNFGQANDNARHCVLQFPEMLSVHYLASSVPAANHYLLLSKELLRTPVTWAFPLKPSLTLRSYQPFLSAHFSHTGCLPILD